MKKLTSSITSVRALLAFFVLAFASRAFADYDIGGPDDGPFAAIVAFIQDIINLIDGPIALAFSFITLGGMALTWALAPKAVQALGVFFRVMVAVIVILNLGVWIAAMQS